MKKILFASFNKHKLAEVGAILSDLCQVSSPSSVGYDTEPVEDAPTLEGNALIKARALYSHSRVPCLADDTGLEVEALNGAPGVRSARYAGEDHNDKANRAKLLSQLSAINCSRRARFRTVLAYIDEEGKEYLFEGRVEGHIAQEERGNGGFGYDAVFIPEGGRQTFAEMTEQEKNSMSHRARAVQAFACFLHEREHGKS